ncbi:MAG: hypothetical protein KAU21_00590 [Gammaproteobacteria bacterium]|nr:hypothetical protein [Gammaproteobacteria bacterium]
MLLITNILIGFVAAIFLILWLKERKHASDVEIVAYGLRAEDDSDDNTKTSISVMESEFTEAIEKLESLGEIHQDEWGNWVWNKTGEKLGEGNSETG